MTLKTSSSKVNKMNGLFHQTIFKKTVLRFWPIWALYLVIMIFLLPVNLYNNLRFLWRTPTDPIPIANFEQALQDDKITTLINVLDVAVTPILIAVFAIIAAVAVFSYLYSARSCNMMHAFPVKRSELFATNYVAGLLFLVVPQIVIALITMAVCGIYHVQGMQYIAIWLLFVIGMSFFFYSLAVFCCMLTGHFFAGFAFFFFFNLVYMVFVNLMAVIAEEICYGFRLSNGMYGIPGMVLSPLVYLLTENRVEFDWFTNEQTQVVVEITGGAVIALYCIPAVILIALALLLYKRRHLECAAEMTAHKFVKPMTRWAVTIVASIGLSFWFAVVFFEGTTRFLPIMILMLIVCSWVIFFLLEMAINKKFKIFKKIRFLEWGICAVVIVLSLVMMEADTFGVEKRVPTVAETKGIIVSANHEMVVVDESEMAQIIQAHQDIVNSKKEYEMADMVFSDVPTEYVSFEYVLKNGKILERSYQIPVDDIYMNDSTRAAGLIRSLQEDMDTAMQSWLVVNYEDMELIGGQMYQYNKTEGGEQTVQLEKEQIEVLYEAMVKDVRANHTGIYFGRELRDDYGYLNCHITFYAELPEQPITTYDLMEALRDSDYNADGISTTVELMPRATYAYDISNTGEYIVDGYFDMYTTCEYTIQALIDLGLIEDVTELMDEETFIY